MLSIHLRVAKSSRKITTRIVIITSGEAPIKCERETAFAGTSSILGSRYTLASHKNSSVLAVAPLSAESIVHGSRNLSKMDIVVSSHCASSLIEDEHQIRTADASKICPHYISVCGPIAVRGRHTFSNPLRTQCLAHTLSRPVTHGTAPYLQFRFPHEAKALQRRHRAVLRAKLRDAMVLPDGAQKPVGEGGELRDGLW